MKWENPPGVKTNSRGPATRKWLEEAAALRARPRQWAVIRQYPTTEYSRAGNLARNIKYGNLGAFMPPGSFDTTLRTTGNTVKVYAMYIGEDENGKSACLVQERTTGEEKKG